MPSSSNIEASKTIRRLINKTVAYRSDPQLFTVDRRGAANMAAESLHSH